MKVLLHTCCAPCSVYCVKVLKQENISIDDNIFENICKRLLNIPRIEYETGVNGGVFNKNKLTIK